VGSDVTHLVSLQDLADGDVQEILDSSLAIAEGRAAPTVSGKCVGLVFFRGSLRTRTSFEAAMHQLGGETINLTAASDFWDLEEQEGVVMDGQAPEHIRDAAAVLSRYVNALAIRPALVGRSWETDRRDAGIRAWSRHSDVPIINMESALWHPLQALADLMTMRQTLGELRGTKLCIAWTHSPTPASFAVVHSLLLAALRFGVDVRIAHPPGYDLDDGVLSEARRIARERGVEVATGLELREAVPDAHVVYARSWGSLDDYGNPTLAASRRARTTGWTIDEGLMRLGDDARLMHAMPVRRNLEVTDEVLDGPRSLVYRQAENRLHSQKALLARLFGGK
jgi:N-acetylornithine carbamoyltransferase